MAKTALRLALICIVVFSSIGTVARILRKSHRAETRFGNDILRVVADVPLTGPAVRFDYQSLDPSTGLLYIAHMNAGQLVVFDVGKREVVRTLDGFHGVHGVIAVPEEKRVYASVTDDHEVAGGGSGDAADRGAGGDDPLSGWTRVCAGTATCVCFRRTRRRGCGNRCEIEHSSQEDSARWRGGQHGL